MNTATEPQPTSRSERKIAFAELQARVGERLQLLVPRYAQGRPFTSSLVGWIEGDFVIVRRPVDNGGPVPLVAGDNVTVRLFTGTDVAEFASTVQRVFGAGLPYCHLDYPSQVKALTLRAEPRVSVALPCRIAVFERDDGRSELVTIRPTAMIGMFGARELEPVAREVEEVMTAILDEVADKT